ncbi:MAG: hypothetical protein JSW70_06985 [Syntrophobacterales bacterium]|nr:MAG: hypothetical protein JSW70_06985 [Syntrophobacterales bacterium]
MTEVKVNYRPRRFGRIKFNIGNRIFRSFVDLMSVRWTNRRHIDHEIEEVIQ